MLRRKVSSAWSKADSSTMAACKISSKLRLHYTLAQRGKS